jgi:hypothetical protein
MRFELAQRLLRAPHRLGLAGVAVRAGFYDQAHCIGIGRALSTGYRGGC